MLPSAHRMRRSREFSRALRGGRRAGQPSLVIHSAPGPADEPSKVGLIVSKQVGSSVVRHRVARRLRAVLAQRMDQWSSGRLIVVRALPAAAVSSSEDLAHDLDLAWARLTGNAATVPTSGRQRERA